MVHRRPLEYAPHAPPRTSFAEHLARAELTIADFVIIAIVGLLMAIFILAPYFVDVAF